MTKTQQLIFEFKFSRLLIQGCVPPHLSQGLAKKIRIQAVRSSLEVMTSLLERNTFLWANFCFFPKSKDSAGARKWKKKVDYGQQLSRKEIGPKARKKNRKVSK